MAKKKPAADAADAAPRKSKYTPEEERAYVEAVIRKQCRLGKGPDADDQVRQRADQLSPEDFTRLHDAGRHGHVAVCRELLGLDE